MYNLGSDDEKINQGTSLIDVFYGKGHSPWGRNARGR